MQVDVEQSVELAGDRAEGAAQPTTENCPGSFSPASDKPDLVIDPSDLPATARALRDLLAQSGQVFDRGGPVKVISGTTGGSPAAKTMSVSRVVCEAHRLCRPVKLVGEEIAPITLPNAVARMYLEMDGEWNLPSLAGICTAPLLSADGSIRTAAGYDQSTRLWCVGIPDLQVPERPTRDDAAAELRLLRKTFQTFPFADAVRRHYPERGVEVVDIDHSPGMDESAFLVGLLTAVCRPSLPLAPGFLFGGPEISGSATGKGKLVRSMSLIVYGVEPHAFTKGGDRQELDKRLAAALIVAAPILLLDNVNNTRLRSDLLASVLTERLAKVRLLGRNQMVALNSSAFIAVTGNGVTLAEDLVRRFVVTKFDACCEDPEQRPFTAGSLRAFKKTEQSCSQQR
jgi:hypothetical protein